MYNWKNHATAPSTAKAMPTILFTCLRPKFMMVIDDFIVGIIIVLLDGKP
jgi:hypothetical protein